MERRSAIFSIDWETGRERSSGAFQESFQGPWWSCASIHADSSLAHHTETNGQTESANRVMKNYL